MNPADLDSLSDAIRLRLIHRRVAMNLTRKALAARACVCANTVELIEQGRVSPTVRVLCKILHAMEINLVDLMNSDPFSGKVQPGHGERPAVTQKHRSVWG